MKLTLKEDEPDEFILYVDMVPYLDTVEDTISEELIQPEDTIKCGDSYLDQVETRLYIKERYLEPIADELKLLPYIENASARNSKMSNPRGLSNYIDIEFSHPDFISEQDVKEFYTYTIRVSDHVDTHPENGPVEPVPIVGMKPKNLRKSIIKIFKIKLIDVQNNIKKYEIENFGEQFTFFED